MLQSSLNSKVALALGRAGGIVGSNHTLYRPTTANTPVGGAAFGSIYCAFDVSPGFKLLSTAQPNHPYSTLLGDPTALQEGDYLVGDDTHFIAKIEPMKPALCILCDRTVDFLSTDVTTSAGTNSYGGRTADTDEVVASTWPVSMSARTRGEPDITKLPSDTRAAYYDVLVPAIPGIVLTFGMRLQDSTGQSYEIVSADNSLFGWRLVAGLATT